MTSRIWAGFALLCGASASAWLLPLPPQSQAVTLDVNAVAYAGVAILSLPFALRRGSRREPINSTSADAAQPVRVWALMLSATGTIAIPLALLEAGRQLSTPAWAVAALASAPLWTVIARTALRGDSLERWLMPSLGALTGALLLLPVTEPASARAALGMALCLAAGGVLGVSTVLCHDEMRKISAAQACSLTALANAIALGICGAAALRLQGGTALSIGQLWPEILFESFTAALALGLLRAMPTRVFATRFLWAPVLTAAEGLLLLRPELSIRTLAGAGLLCFGGALLLRRDERVSDEILSLR